MFPIRIGTESAMVSWRDSQGSSLLHVHTCMGNEVLTRVLLEMGCDVGVRNDRDETPLTCANFSKPGLIDRLLKAGADVHAFNCLGQRPLHMAVGAHNEESVRLLLNAGADPNVTDRNDNTPLHIAVDAGLTEIVRILVERGAEINRVHSDYSILSLACRTRNESIVKILLDAGADVKAVNMDGTSALHFGVWLRKPELTRVMVAKGADVNKQDADGFAVLHEAVYEGNIHQVRLLVECNADISIKTLEGDTPLHWAAFGNIPDSYEILEFLLARGADCDAPNIDKTTPFHFALKKNDSKIIQLFLDNGAEIGAVNIKGETSLHFVAENSCTDVIEYILSIGFDIDLQNSNGFSALHYAAESGNTEGCRILVKHGANVHIKCKEGRTALHLAVRMKQLKSAQFLLEHGANVFERTTKGQSILDVVLENGSERLSNVLLQHVAKLESTNVNLDERDRRLIQECDRFQVYYRACVQELNRMKEKRLNDEISLFDVLVKAANVISGYARNDDLVTAFKILELEKAAFPIYFASLATRFYKAVKKQKLLKYAANVLSEIFKFNDPIHIVNQKILSYLTDEDLKYFCK